MARPKTDDDATKNLKSEDQTQEAREGTKIGLLRKDKVLADLRKIVRGGPKDLEGFGVLKAELLGELLGVRLSHPALLVIDDSGIVGVHDSDWPDFLVVSGFRKRA